MNAPGTAGGPPILATKVPATMAQSNYHAAANAAYNALFTPPPPPPGIGLGSVGSAGQGNQPLPGTIVGNVTPGTPTGMAGGFGQPSPAFRQQPSYPVAVLRQYAPAFQPPVATVPTPVAPSPPQPTLAPQSHAATAVSAPTQSVTGLYGPTAMKALEDAGITILPPVNPMPSAPAASGYHLNTPISPEELPTHALTRKPPPRAAIRR
jgi:hypothetical protein